MINGGPLIAVILTLDGSLIIFLCTEKNIHVVFKMLHTLILLWNKFFLTNTKHELKEQTVFSPWRMAWSY